jgi:hypothetical protein
VTRPRTGRSGARNRLGAGDFSLFQNVETDSGAHPASFNRYGASFPGIKWPRRAVTHLLQSSAEVENKWSFTFTPPIRLHGVDKDNYTGLLWLRSNFLIQVLMVVIMNRFLGRNAE